MAYDLAEFCAEARLSLTHSQLAEALEAISASLRRLLASPDFIASAFAGDPPPGKRELFRDADTDFRVLAHVQAPGKAGKPHSHGASWAVYGAAMGSTGMAEWRRVNDGAGEAHVLAKTGAYTLDAGQTRAYGPGVIHSTSHPRKAWVIRVTGTDLDSLPRYRFRETRDTILTEA